MTTPTREVDVLVLGGGTAGMGAYRAARAAGRSALLVEASRFGTTCARVGCMPSKLLIAAAEAVHTAAHAAPFGVAPMRPEVDRRRVMDRVRSERDRFVGFVTASVDGYPEADKLMGHARFVTPHDVAVGDLLVRARAIVIATGSRPAVPRIFEPLGDLLVVNDDVFSWEQLPTSVAVFGPGVIGLELGQALHRLGVRVRVFGRGTGLGPLTDPVVKKAAHDAFAAELPLDTDADVRSLSREGKSAVITFVERGELRVERFDHVLVATGRVPNTDRIGIENAGVLLDERGAPRFDAATLQCGRSHVFIAGDATSDRPLLHEAADEGRIAGENAARYPDVRPAQRRSPLAIVFTDPQLAMVGDTHAEASARGAIVGRVSFDDQGRSRVMRKNVGALAVYADSETGRLLGAEMAGPAAEHIGHLLAWAHQLGLTIDQMLALPFYHPVVEEGLRTALRDASAKLAAR